MQYQERALRLVYLRGQLGAGVCVACHEGGSRLRRRLAAASLGALLLTSVPVAGSAGSAPLELAVSGGNGVVRTTDPGRPCGEGGDGSYRHYLAEALLAPGVLAALAGSVRATLDVHYDGDPTTDADGPNAFLLGTQSHVTLSNERGTVRVLLRGGTCEQPALNFDGTTARFPSGTWRSDRGDVTGTGAYRALSGSGTFAFEAEMNPGADNRWSLRLDGAVEVPGPALAVRVERVFWGNLGLDYLTRVVTVVYRVGNTGAGDAFGARFTDASSTDAGVRACGEPPGVLASCPRSSPPSRGLGDLAACGDPALPPTCDSKLLTVRYQLGLLGPCGLVILACEFDTLIGAELSDALDVASAQQATVRVRAPDLPPPL